MTKEERKEYNRQYYQNHKKEIAENKKGYYDSNKVKILKYKKEYQEKRRKEYEKYRRMYYSTQFGRAKYLLYQYKIRDKKLNRGDCTINEQWIIDNIFNSKCIYCGKTDWKELGCDRIDNDKPHTPDNIVCSCGDCNKERGKKAHEEFLKIKKG